MSRYSDHDQYTDPLTGVLKNRLGITDGDLLASTEADMVAARSRELALSPLRGRFDLEHLQAVHRYMFGDLYEWAGELRVVDIGKGNTFFAHHAHIRLAAAPIFLQLSQERHLEGLGPGSFSQRAAHYLAEMNALHPFREGNGRAIREFTSILADKNGYYIAWENTSQSDMLRAAVSSFHGRMSELVDLIRENLEIVSGSKVD